MRRSRSPPPPPPSAPPPPPPFALKRVCTVVPVLRFIRINIFADILKIAHVSTTFCDALVSYSKPVWRRIATRLQPHSLATLFMHDAFVWAADNLLIDGELDVSRMETHPLFIATRAGAVHVMRVCLDADGAFVHVRDGLGKTALHLACGAGHAECVNVLLFWYGADITATDNLGRTALHDAVERRKYECVRLLAAHPDYHKNKLYDKRDIHGNTAMAVARAATPEEFEARRHPVPPPGRGSGCVLQ